MLKATIKAEKLKSFIKAVMLRDEVLLKLTPDGISTKTADITNVTAVFATLSKGAFDSFEATEGEFGINLTKLDRVLKFAKKSHNITLQLDESIENLIIKIHSLCYNITLIPPHFTIGGSKIKIPDLNFSAKVVLEGKQFKCGIDAAHCLSDRASMVVRDNTFLVEADNGYDMFKFTMEKDQLINIASDRDVKSLFNLDYLSDLIGVACKADEVTIELGQDYPIRISFNIADGCGNIIYLQAPRIEED